MKDGPCQNLKLLYSDMTDNLAVVC